MEIHLKEILMQYSSADLVISEFDILAISLVSSVHLRVSDVMTFTNQTLSVPIVVL